MPLCLLTSSGILEKKERLIRALSSGIIMGGMDLVPPIDHTYYGGYFEHPPDLRSSVAVTCHRYISVCAHFRESCLVKLIRVKFV